MAWTDTAQQYLERPELVVGADLNTICKLLTSHVAERYKLNRIYPEQLAGVASKSVTLFRPSMRIDLEKANDINGIPHSQKMPHQREPAKLTITDLKKTHAGYHPREKDQGRD